MTKEFQVKFNQYKELAEIYVLKKSMHIKPQVKEKEGFRLFNLYEPYIDKAPSWFDGKCQSLPGMVEFAENLDSWETRIMERAAEKGYVFSRIQDADVFLRVCRARKFLKEAIALYKELPQTKRFEKYEIKKLILELQKSIEKGEGVARSGATILQKRIARQEMEATSTSVNWNTVVKVPRMSSK